MSSSLFKIMLAIVLTMLFTTLGHSQDTINLQLKHLFASSPILKDTATYTTPSGLIEVNNLQYYITNIRVSHDNGLETLVSSEHYLINRKNTFLQLGTVSGITQIDSIRFDIGVNPLFNHADPGSYASEHPLAYQSPSMHWGWQSGYLFFAFDGLVDTNSDNVWDGSMSYHIIGDEMIRTVRKEVSGAVVKTANKYIVKLAGDYYKIFDGFTGLRGIAHGAYPTNKDMATNYDKVFFKDTLATTNVLTLASLSTKWTYKSAVQQLLLETEEPFNTKAQIILVNLMGQTITQKQLTGNQTNLALPVTLTPGVYFALLTDGHQLMEVYRFVYH